MRILVTGSNGLLGRTLVPYLRSLGYDVIGSSRMKGTDKRVLDLSEALHVQQILDSIRPDIIVNLAAMTDVDGCERHPAAAYRSNAEIVNNLVAWISNYNRSCHLVQVSTDQIYDGPGVHTEDDITLSNYYGYSKYIGELLASTVPCTVLRTNFFGPGQHPNRISFSDWIVSELSARRSITVFEDIYFSPLTMSRVVKMVALTIIKQICGTYNLGSKNGMNKADFAFNLADVLELSTQSMSRGTSDDLDLIAYRPKNMCMDTSLFEEKFGVELPTLQEEIQDVKDEYNKNSR